MNNKINNKGFTLVELIATIVVLGLVVGFSSYAIINVLNSTKKNNYELLISNIKSAAETYYHECKFSMSDSIRSLCSNDTITLKDLVTYGYLKGNSEDLQTIVNPKNDNDISHCQIRITKVNSQIAIESVNPTGSCPTSYQGVDNNDRE